MMAEEIAYADAHEEAMAEESRHAIRSLVVWGKPFNGCLMGGEEDGPAE
jgi:hypothetical protein